MFLLDPAWLLALGAAVVPIALHLISRGRYRRIRVGSVRLIQGNDSLRGRRFRPSQLLLLAVRCALLAALALALAGPRAWRAPADGTDRGEWALVSPEVLASRAALEAANLEAFARLDAQVADGAELRLLAPGIPRGADPAEAILAYLDDWSLLREADRLAEPGVRFHVFTLDRLEALRGERPRLTRPVDWTALSPPEANRWIERAGPADAGRVPVVVGASAPERTTFRREEAAGPGGDVVTAPEVGVRLARGGFLNGDDRIPAGLDLPPLSVAVRHDVDRAEDAAYVEAGLAGVSEFARLPLAVSVEIAGNVPSRFDLMFRLSAGPVPAGVLEALATGGVLVSDGLGEHESCDTRAILGDLPGAGEVRVHRRSPVEATDDGAVIWTDGFGRPLLEVSAVGDGLWYRLHGRIHPLWSSLPLDPAFPEWLASLVEGRARVDRVRSAGSRRSDLRSADPAQRQPAAVAASDSHRSRRADASPEPWLWLAVFALFGLERFLAAGSPAR